MTPAVWIAVAMLASLVAYTITGGADFGGGVWDLLARGPRADAQRATIAKAIAPIWEANHVWLIIVVVLLFVCFPVPFAAISTSLHIPMLLMLIGIVLRGAAFTFRAYGRPSPDEVILFSRLFAVTSLLTPLMLGIVLGAVARGVPVDPVTGRATTNFVDAWWAPFPVAVGVFVLILFAFLAAVYLILETDDTALQDDFRARALGSGVALAAAALVAFLLAGGAAPAHPAFHILTGAAAVGALAALWTRRYAVARILAIGQATLIVVGFGATQNPYILPPHLEIAAWAAPDSVLSPVLTALAAGIVVLVPSFWYLYAVFKGART